MAPSKLSSGMKIGSHNYFTLFLLLSALFSPLALGDEGNRVREFMQAYNRHDLSAMRALLAPQARWMSIENNTLSVEAAGADEILNAVGQFFSDRPETRSSLHLLQSSGDFVWAVEAAHSLQDGEPASQCAPVMYEFENGLIVNVWYFPISKCPD